MAILKRYWIALIAGSAMLYLIMSPAPQEPIESADGLYANACCGSFSLRHGTLSAAGIHVPYVVEKGKKHPYIVPKVYVGVVGGHRIATKSGANDTVLTFDDTELNPIIWLPGDDGNDYPFESQTLR